jgi:tRNA (guanine-N7-)-methyltransferase
MEEIANNGYSIVDYRPDLYASLSTEADPLLLKLFSIKTHYEALFHAKGHVIKYVSFTIH